MSAIAQLREKVRVPRRFQIVLVVLIACVAISGIRRSTDGLDQGASLDKPMLKLELPRSKDELRTIATPATAEPWRDAQYWDFLFIASYIMLFGLLAPRNASLPDSMWESPSVCILTAGILDYGENLSLLACLRHIEQLRNPGQRAFALLLVFGALKWLFFFLACRALAIQYSKLKEWVFSAVFLRAFATVGAWATVLAFVGLPSRPIITLAMWGITFVLVTVLARTLIGPTSAGVAASAS